MTKRGAVSWRVPINIAIFLLMVAGCPLSAKSDLPSRITIHVSWRGLGRPRDETYVITVVSGRGLRDGYTVPMKRIDRLLNAVTAKPILSPHAGNLGLTTAWLSRHAPDAATVYRSMYSGPSITAHEAAFFSKALLDPSNIHEFLLVEYGKFLRTDDYPHATIEITWVSGRRVEIQSASQAAFMLPWTIGTHVNTYNANLSRSVAALLPQGALNRSRINGDDLSGEYVLQVHGFVEDKLDSIRAGDILGGQLDPLRSNFQVESLQVAGVLSDDWDGQKAVNATLRDRSLPKNVRINLSLVLDSRNRVHGLSQSIAAERYYASLVMSVPWLRSYLSANRGASAEIRVVQNYSLTRQLTNALLSDLKLHGKKSLAQRITPTLHRTAFIYLKVDDQKYARWFVFPDRTMLLWNYRGGTPLQDEIKGLPTWDWYAHVDVQALFSPVGVLLR